MRRRPVATAFLVRAAAFFAVVAECLVESAFFDEWGFRRSVDETLDAVQSILDDSRHPVLVEPSTVHTYDDKYALVEYATNAALLSYVSAMLFPRLRSKSVDQAVRDHPQNSSASNASTRVPAYTPTWISSTIHDILQPLKKILATPDNTLRPRPAVHLRFEASLRCSFEKELQREVASAEREVETTRGGTGLTGGRIVIEKETTKTKKRFREFVWKVELDYKISLTASSLTPSTADEAETVVLFPYKLSGADEDNNRRTAGTPRTVFVSTYSGSESETRPTPPVQNRSTNRTMDVTWLLGVSDNRANHGRTSAASADDDDDSLSFHPHFTIDRDVETCRTPRRNTDTDKAVAFSQDLSSFWLEIEVFFHRVDRELRNLSPSTVPPKTSQQSQNFADRQAQSTQQDFLGQVLDESLSAIFLPIAPIIDNSTVPSADDLQTLNGHFVATLLDTVSAFQQSTTTFHKDFSTSGLVASEEATLVLVARLVGRLTKQHVQSVTFIEETMKKQLIQAVGKRLTSRDFDRFMRFNNKRLLSSQFASVPFSRAVRLPGRFPAGVVTIEESNAAGRSGTTRPTTGSPIETIARRIEGSLTDSPVYIPIDATTNIAVRGDKFIHGWIQHVWGGEQPSYHIAARANQFSSYILVLGVMGGADTFFPKAAIVVKNKDEVLVPLLTTPLPSAAEFRDSIVSLSPEQQAFAKAYRSMQLETSVFGLCIIQIKPQLERLLNLPLNSLTKEIQLTQDLMSLFVEYQIPSDLLTYDAAPASRDGASTNSTVDLTKTSIDAVKSHVATVLEVIEHEKQTQIREKKQRDEILTRDKPEPTTDSRPGRELLHGRPRQLSRSAPSRSFASEAMAMSDTMELHDTTFEMPQSRMMSKPMTSTMNDADTGRRNSRNQQKQGYDTVQNKKRGDDSEKASRVYSGAILDDFTLLPKLLDSQLEASDEGGYLRSTVIEIADDQWLRKRQRSLILPTSDAEMLSTEDVRSERNDAFDLVTALSRSGSLSIEDTELHVMVGVSHCFPNTLIGTVIEDNLNPIEKVERSVLLVASLVHDRPELVDEKSS